MPKRKKPPEKPKDQFKRFLETAEQHEVDGDKVGSAVTEILRAEAKATSDPRRPKSRRPHKDG